MAIEGPITSSVVADGSVTTAKLANDAVTYAKIQNVSATDKILGRSTAGSGDVEEITCTPAARSILDDTTVGAILATIGGQPVDDTLTALAGLSSSAGVIEQTSADVFAIRAIGSSTPNDLLRKSDGTTLFAPISHSHVISQITDLAYRYLLPATWYRENIAISLTDDALDRQGQTASFAKTIKMPRAGSIVAITTRLNTPVTAGTLQVFASVNGSESSMSVTSTSGSNASGGTSTQAPGTDAYSAGNEIGVFISTDAGFLPITADIEVWIQVEEAY